jgi:type IV secretion system protein VirB6
MLTNTFTFDSLFQFFDVFILSNVNAMVGTFTDVITPLLMACVLLYITYLAWQAMFDAQNMMFETSIKTIASLAVVTTIGLNTTWYLANVVPSVLYMGDDIASNLLGSSGMGSVQFAFDNMMARIVKMWELMDFDFLSLDALSSTALLVLQVILCIIGFIPFIALATTYLLLAKFMVGLLLIIGPLFIMMAFFPVTRSLFQSWSGQCLNYILLSILYPISFSFFVKILDFMLASELSLTNSFFLCIVFLVMNASSTQIPVLTFGLSGGVGINGLTGGAMLGALKLAGKGAGKGLLSIGKKIPKSVGAVATLAKQKIKAG